MCFMGNKVDWDFALELSGITPDALPMAALAEYLTQWSGLLGVEHRPIYKGAVKGSAVLRASVGETDRASTFARLHNAANDDNARPFLIAIEALMARDGLRKAKVTDRNGGTIQVVRVTPQATVPQIIVFDSSEIDGRVFRLSGKDNTTSVGLIEDLTGDVITVETNNESLARDFANHFKGPLLRVSVRGTWTRKEEGGWTPKRLTADTFHVLEDVSLLDTMRTLRAAKGNDWNRMTPDQAMEAWRELRHGPWDDQEGEE